MLYFGSKAYLVTNPIEHGQVYLNCLRMFFFKSKSVLGLMILNYWREWDSTICYHWVKLHKNTRGRFHQHLRPTFEWARNVKLFWQLASEKWIAISPTFYEQLLRQYSLTKRIQSQTVSTKKLLKTQNPVIKYWWNWLHNFDALIWCPHWMTKCWWNRRACFCQC